MCATARSIFVSWAEARRRRAEDVAFEADWADKEGWADEEAWADEKAWADEDNSLTRSESSLGLDCFSFAMHITDELLLAVAGCCSFRDIQYTKDVARYLLFALLAVAGWRSFGNVPNTEDVAYCLIFA